MIQHFVPRWYLKSWTFDERSDLVCVLDKAGQPKVLPLALAGAAVDWYTMFLPGGDRDDTIERKLLDTIDDHGCTTTRALIAHNQLGPRQLEHFCTFLGWFVLRGPDMNRRAARAANELNDARRRGNLAEQITPLGPTAMSRGGERLPIPDGLFEFSRADMLEMLKRRRAPEAIGKMFLRRSRWFHVRRFDEPLLQTCDSPVVYEEAFVESAELALATYFPLSPSAALIIGAESKTKPSAVDLSDTELARLINRLVSSNAIEQRFCRPTVLG